MTDDDDDGDVKMDDSPPQKRTSDDNQQQQQRAGAKPIGGRKSRVDRGSVGQAEVSYELDKDGKPVPVVKVKLVPAHRIDGYRW